MPLRLEPMPPSGIPLYEDLVTDAFADSLQSVFYPGGFSAEAKAHTIAAETSLWESVSAEVAARGPAEAVGLHYMQVVDTDLLADGDASSETPGGVVGVAKWQIYPRRRTAAELAAEDAAARQHRALPPGINATCVRAFYGALQDVKAALFGPEPYVILQVLVTHPAHHPRGVGAMHLRWGEELADRLGLPLYLEASAMGKPLYERWGYVERMKIPFDAREWGGRQEMPHVAMVRPVRGGKKVVDDRDSGICWGENGR